MCNLYSQTRNVDAIRQLFRVSHNRTTSIEPQPAIFPGWNGSVIRKADDGERELVTMSWGFVLLQPGKAPRRVTNVRDDKILKSSFWKSSFDQGRCLVPASSSCEPDADKPAKWHWFAVNGGPPRRLFAFPGIWQRWKGQVKKESERRIGRLQFHDDGAQRADRQHQSRTDAGPVIRGSRLRDLTFGFPAEAFALARSFDPAQMRIVQSGFEKKDLFAA
jgi:hypothetical protein